MKARDLFRLSVGKYDVTDTVYIYEIDVCISDFTELKRYFISVKHHSEYGRILLSQHYASGKFYLHALSGIGSLYVSSNDCNRIYSILKFIPRGSFSEFVKRTI